MKDIFSFSLYKEGIGRVRHLGIGFLVAMVLLNLAGALISETTRDTVAVEEYMTLSIVLAAFVPVLTYSAFSFINDRASSDFYHAMPQKRKCVFLSLMASVITWIALLVLAGNVTSYLSWELIKEVHVPFSVAARAFLCYGTMSLAFSAYTAFAMMFTGTPTAAVFAASALIWVTPLLSFFFQSWVERFYPRVSQWHSVFNYLGYEQFTPIRIALSDDGFALDLGLLLNLLSAVVFIALACIAYTKRKSEGAGRFAVGKVPRHIVRGALPFLLLLVAFNYSSKIVDNSRLAENYYTMAASYVIVAAVLFFFYEIISTKSIKRTLRAMPWFLTVVLAAVVFVGGARLMAFSFEVRDPDSADEIKSITLTAEDYATRKYYGSEVSALLGVRITDKNVIASVYKDFTATNGDYLLGGNLYCDVKMETQNGRTLWRRVRVKTNDVLREYAENSIEAGKQRYPVPNIVPAEGTDEELWSTFKAEFDTLTYGQRKAVYIGKGEYRVYRVNGQKEDNSGELKDVIYRFNVYPEDMPRTYEMLKEKGSN